MEQLNKIYIVGAVESDDTLRDFIQQIEFEILLGEQPEVQLCIDRKNKKDIKQSKPVAWIHFSELHQLIKLVELSVRSLTLAIPDHVSEERIESFLNETLNLIKNKALQDLTASRLKIQEMEQKDEEEKSWEKIFE